jgi:hypothetical protein
MNDLRKFLIRSLVAVFAVVLAAPAFAVQPTVKTVPWVASNPLIPHDTWSGNTIRLKGTKPRLHR